MAKSEGDLNAVLSSASKLASYNMVLQLSFRILTFLLNAFVLRYVTKDLLGVVNVRLLLLYSTILFLSREAFRRACLSTDIASKEETSKHPLKTNKQRWTEIINLLWYMIPVGLLFTLLLTYCWIYLLESPNPSVVSYYQYAALTYGFCAWIELLVEPLWIVGQAFLFVKLRVISEGVAILAKCIATVPLVVYFPHWGLISFCITMVVFSIIYISIYYGYFLWFIKSGKCKKLDDFPLQEISDIFPKFIDGKYSINWNYAVLTFSFLKQSVLKQFLTEGERYVMTILNVLSFSDQGVYDVINNLGSLAARFIFLPIEDSFYLFFSKTLKRGESAEAHPKHSMEAITNVLHHLLRLVVLIGSIILAFGLPYSHLLLDIYGGALLSSGTGPLLMQFYCLYVLFIAINGTTECFVFAAMSEKDVNNYNKKMFLFSILFLFSSYYLTLHVGSVGFILANCLNMATRIIHSIWFVTKFYRNSSFDSPLHGLIPTRNVIISLFLSCIICMYSEKYFCCEFGTTSKFLHVLIGLFCLLLVTFAIWIGEKKLLLFLRKQYFPQKTD